MKDGHMLKMVLELVVKHHRKESQNEHGENSLRKNMKVTRSKGDVLCGSKWIVGVN